MGANLDIFAEYLGYLERHKSKSYLEAYDAVTPLLHYLFFDVTRDLRLLKRE
jgi:hypothetical protein